MFSELRVGSFSSVSNVNNLAFFTPTGPYDLSTYNGTIVAYYDKAGSISSSGSADRYFKSVVTFAPQPGLYLTRVTHSVIWPAKAQYPLNTNVFITNIAWYDK